MISSFDNHSTARAASAKLPPGLEAREELNDQQSRPLVTVTAALYKLAEFELDAEGLRELIESGKLIAFDIAAAGGRPGAKASEH